MRETTRIIALALVLMTLVTLSVVAPSASAADAGGGQNGLLNPSFEDGLQGWVGKMVTPPAVDGDPSLVEDATCDADQRSGVRTDGICIIEGSDSFDVTKSLDPICTGDGVDYACTPQSEVETVAVAPNDGARMVRLGGPYLDLDVAQPMDRKLLLRQSFVVPNGTTTLPLNYNVYTWDYQGYDELRLDIRLTDAETGELIGTHEQGAFGAAGDTSLKSTGWLSTGVDLEGYEGHEVYLTVSARGTLDNILGFWVYLDGGKAPDRPEKQFTVETPVLPGTTTPLEFTQAVDLSTGSTWLTIGSSDAEQFDDPATPEVECAPLTISTILPGGPGTEHRNVELIVEPNDDLASMARYEMTRVGGGNGTGLWQAVGVCAIDADLFVTYTASEQSMSHTFIVPIGGITLIDPQGVVYDRVAFDAAKARGLDDEAARAEAKVVGATVRLQRLTDGEWQHVLSADPGISPHVNPQPTNADGIFRWDTSAGTYRVIVTAAGFVVTTSREVTVPPEVTDLHVALERNPVAPQPTTDGGATGTGTTGTTGPTTTRETTGTTKATSPRGTRNADELRGSAIADLIRGLAGNDRIFGRAGADRLFGGAGRDLLYGEVGNDRLSGEAGDDELRGGAGSDRLVGGRGRDLVIGGAGNDSIDVRDGAGGDVVTCGSGRDKVVADRGDRLAADCER